MPASDPIGVKRVCVCVCVCMVRGGGQIPPFLKISLKTRLGFRTQTVLDFSHRVTSFQPSKKKLENFALGGVWRVQKKLLGVALFAIIKRLDVSINLAKYLSCLYTGFDATSVF